MASAVGIAEPRWLAARRERAVALSAELTLPNSRTAGWEFTDIAGLDLDAYPPALGREAEAELAEAESWLSPPASAASDEAVAEPAEGVTVMALLLAAERHPELVERHFGRIVSPADPFVARNEAAWTDGTLVHVARGASRLAPIRLHATLDEPERTRSHRTLIVLEEGAEAEVWEEYLSPPGDLDAVFNGVVEIVVGPGANLRYVCAQGLSERSWAFVSQRAEVERDGQLEWVALGFGSGRGKMRMETKLAGSGAGAKVTGAYAGRGRQHLDFDTTQEHAAPNTTSDLAFRGVLDGRANAVWRGMIRVDPGAQRTDAFQESRNLLLSKRAHADAVPGLEIQANDVRCTHAAAVAQIDRDQIFYLMSRGLARQQAQRLIIDGFMQALVERFPEGAVHDAVSGALERRLAQILDP